MLLAGIRHIKRFFELKPFLDESDADIASLIPSGSDLIKLQGLLKDLESLYPVTQKLQEEKCTM